MDNTRTRWRVKQQDCIDKSTWEYTSPLNTTRAHRTTPMTEQSIRKPLDHYNTNLTRFTLFESVRDYALCKTGTRRFLTPYQFIKGKQYSCPPVNSLAGKLIRSIMFVSLVVFLMMFAGRAVSYELEDYDEDEEDFAMIYAKIERF